jgi:hypothetical protein
MKTSTKGDLAVLKVLERCLEKGVTASKPISECCRYDLVLDDGELWRTQVKYADSNSGHSTGCTTVRLVSSSHLGSRTYSEDEIDVVIAYLPKTKKVYWLPSDVWRGKSVVTLRHEPSKNNQRKGVIDAAEFEW